MKPRRSPPSSATRSATRLPSSNARKHEGPHEGIPRRARGIRGIRRIRRRGADHRHAAASEDDRFEPASLTKLMTAYIVFAALRDHRLDENQAVTVSVKASKARGSRMFLDPAHPATVHELIQGLVVESGNDAAIALAEAVAGTEDEFV